MTLKFPEKMWTILEDLRYCNKRNLQKFFVLIFKMSGNGTVLLEREYNGDEGQKEESE